MLIQLCQFLRLNLRQRRVPKGRQRSAHSRGQSLVIFAVMMLGLLFFVGLAADSGSLYVTYGQLKRAVDSAAVAAANDFKRGATVTRMTEAAYETLALHNIDMGNVDLRVYICDADGDGIRDDTLQTELPQFYSRCPNTNHPTNPQAPRKLVWVEGQQRAPLYFLTLLGFNTLDLRTSSIAEAAPVDVVIVLDISESMGNRTPGFTPANFDPSSCNSNNTCQPLAQAKDAANVLIDTLYEGYDRVSVVTFDNIATIHPIQNLLGVSVILSDNLTAAKDVVNSIQLHDDAPGQKVWPDWVNNGALNPVFLEDRDGDGRDIDSGTPTCDVDPYHTNPPCCTLNDNRWDYDPAKFSTYPFGGGFPCDSDTLYDAVNWDDSDAIYTANDNALGAAWVAAGKPVTFLSTCTGCGIRVSADVLKAHARSNAVWAIVFLSDGAVNLSDLNATNPNIPVAFKQGFCPTGFRAMSAASWQQTFWWYYCSDVHPEVRHCIDSSSTTCPPGTTYVDTSAMGFDYRTLPYSVFDYALDMTDAAALTRSANPNETSGNDIAIYAVGLGDAGTNIWGVDPPIGEQILRYMADVGDDGDRTTRPCNGVAVRTSCGQYYFAQTGNDLLPIFEDIATRIYTRLTE